MICCSQISYAPRYSHVVKTDERMAVLFIFKTAEKVPCCVYSVVCTQTAVVHNLLHLLFIILIEELYEALILSTLRYSAELWPLTVTLNKKLEAAHHRWLRGILGITWRDKVTKYEEVRKRTGKHRWRR